MHLAFSLRIVVADSGIHSNLFTFFVPTLFNVVSLAACRYHYNVADTRLRQHVDKGNEDGLYISCVASQANLWALIMDAGTGFSSQVYELSAMFLHKVIEYNLYVSFY